MVASAFVNFVKELDPQKMLSNHLDKNLSRKRLDKQKKIVNFKNKS